MSFLSTIFGAGTATPVAESKIESISAQPTNISIEKDFYEKLVMKIEKKKEDKNREAIIEYNKYMGQLKELISKAKFSEQMLRYRHQKIIIFSDKLKSDKKYNRTSMYVGNGNSVGVNVYDDHAVFAEYIEPDQFTEYEDMLKIKFSEKSSYDEFCQYFYKLYTQSYKSSVQITDEINDLGFTLRVRRFDYEYNGHEKFITCIIITISLMDYDMGLLCGSTESGRPNAKQHFFMEDLCRAHSDTVTKNLEQDMILIKQKLSDAVDKDQDRCFIDGTELKSSVELLGKKLQMDMPKDKFKINPSAVDLICEYNGAGSIQISW
jgi:hypothetical protein